MSMHNEVNDDVEIESILFFVVVVAEAEIVQCVCIKKI